jgi:hypothetical protein
MANTNEIGRFPLLDSLLQARGLQRQAIYTIKATAAVFDVSSRTIDDWCNEGKLLPRDLPGHGRFPNEDLEEFLQRSKRRRKKREDSDGDDDRRPS